MDRYSLPEFQEPDSNFSLDEKILLLRSCGGSFTQKGWTKTTSLPALVEEEEETSSNKSKRRSKSIDSYITCTWG